VQVPDLDLTCALELQKKTCNIDDVSVENGERIHLSSVHYADALACVSGTNPQCVPRIIQGLQAVRPRGPDELGTPTHVFLESTRGDNRMVLGVVFTPNWTPFRIPTGMDERELRIQTVLLPGSGRVHYETAVTRYFAGLPFCFDHENWSDFYVSRTMALLKSMCPCKTKQNGRDNFVYYHSAELGMHFLDETVLAFFKTPGGHNSVADMRASQNIFIVHLVTSTAAFDTYALTEMRLATGSGIPKMTTGTTASDIFVGDIFTYTPPPQQIQLNVTILIPHPLWGQQNANYTLQYPSMAFSLSFAGVYTIVEDIMVARKGGTMLPSQTRKYVNVRKRSSAQYAMTNTSVVVPTPLKYVTLTGIRAQTALLQIATKSVRMPVAFLQSHVPVQHGTTDNVAFKLWQQSASMPACNRSREWDKFDTNMSRSNRDIDNLLPCYIAHDINGTLRNVAYIRDIVTRETYATYTDTTHTTTFIVNVTDDYRTIFRSSGGVAATLLSTAIARPRVDTTLSYNSVTREENLWQHLTVQTTQSCQDLIPHIASIQDEQDQYISLVQLLKRNGPCAPGFTGYDILQDPGDVEFADSECVLTATTLEDTTARDALLVVQRQYMNESDIYEYSAQYLTPALVRQVFGSPSENAEQMSFCNVRNREHSPAAIETALSRVGLWTLPQDVAATDAGIVVQMPQIRQSGSCP